MNRHTFTVVALSLLTARSAFAQDTNACVEASTKAQNLRDAHKLVEARTELRTCSQSSCPKVVQADCVGWLDEVEKSIPTLVLSATDDAGEPLVNVKVTVDGAPLAARLDGSAIAMNPGLRRFHFEGVNGGVDKQVMVAEGDKNRAVAVVIPRATSTGEPPPPSGHVDPPPPAPDAPPSSGSPLRTVGFVVGGVGLGGVILGAIFGGLATASKSNANCDAAGACDAEPLAAARAQATVSTIGLIAGGVLLAAGITLVIVAPKSTAAPAAAFRVELTPMVGTTTGAWLGVRY